MTVKEIFDKANAFNKQSQEDNLNFDAVVKVIVNDDALEDEFKTYDEFIIAANTYYIDELAKKILEVDLKEVAPRIYKTIIDITDDYGELHKLTFEVRLLLK